MIKAPLVLVTGAPGWLGTALVHALVYGLPETAGVEGNTGLQVRCLVQPGHNTTALRAIAEQVETFEGDLTDVASVQRFVAGAKGGILLHAAGIIHPSRVRDFYRINVEGTRNLVEAAVAVGVQRAVVVSSNAPLGCNPHPDHLFDEASPYHPYLGYGRSKMLMEQYVRSQHEQGHIEVVIIRPPWFYGPGQPPRQTLFFKMICDGTFPIVGSGENRRSMAYIENLCQGILLAAAHPNASGQTYWVADERPYSINEIVSTIARLMKEELRFACKDKTLRMPSILSDIAYMADSLFQAIGVYHQKIHVLSEMNKTIACTVEKAKRELGYHPTVALEEGMRRSLRWCLQQGLLT